MKKLLSTIEEDYQNEGFTLRDWIVYGVIVPTIFVAGCILSELINKL